MTHELTARQIISRLRENGYEAYIAGGAARDRLAGETPKDYDVVTNASHDAVRELFSGRKCSVVGISFKICIVDGVDVASYRKDAAFGRKNSGLTPHRAESIQEDLARRDLTINAMAWCPVTGEVVDPFNGQADLKNKIVRFTGNPGDRIHEDPCRIVRACRFKAALRGVFDPESLSVMKALGKTVQTVAPERLHLEITKALAVDYPSLFFNALWDVGVLSLILPGLAACYGHDGGRHHAETLDVHHALVGDALPASKPLLRLAGYLHDIGKPPTAEVRDDGLSFYGHEKVSADMVEKELKALAFSVKDIDYVKGLVRHHMRSVDSQDKPKTIRRVLKKLSDDGVFWKDWIRLKIADAKGNVAKDDYSKERIKNMVLAIRNVRRPSAGTLALSVKDLAVSGRDVLETLSLKPGPRVGEILADILDYVLDDPTRNTKGHLIARIRQVGP